MMSVCTLNVPLQVSTAHASHQLVHLGLLDVVDSLDAASNVKHKAKLDPVIAAAVLFGQRAGTCEHLLAC